MAMSRVEQVLVEAFGERSSLSLSELLEVAGRQESPPLLREAQRSLSAKGVIDIDDWNVASLNRNRAQEVREAPQLYEPLLGE
jgi:hypothetical protein